MGHPFSVLDATGTMLSPVVNRRVAMCLVCGASVINQVTYDNWVKQAFRTADAASFQRTRHHLGKSWMEHCGEVDAVTKEFTNNLSTLGHDTKRTCPYFRQFEDDYLLRGNNYTS
jgi:hypothetical protein